MTTDRTASLVVPIPSRESSQAKALRLLLTGRVCVLMLLPGRCSAHVRGDSGRTYNVVYRGFWRCDCQAGARRCAHRRAVELVVDLSGPADGHQPKEHPMTTDAAADYQRLLDLQRQRREIHAAQTRARAARIRAEKELDAAAASLRGRGIPADQARTMAAEGGVEEHNQYVAVVDPARIDGSQ